jgi:hypothetical protein
MNGRIPQRTLTSSAGAAPGLATPSREFQELWYTLTLRNWTSVVLVPADAGGSAAAVATSLAEAGMWLRDGAVTLFVMSDPLDYASATQVAPATSQAGTAGAESAPERVIIAVQPVVVEPLGLAVTQAADAVILCIELGRTRLAAARRTIELVGRERIGGCFLVT